MTIQLSRNPNAPVFVVLLFRALLHTDVLDFWLGDMWSTIWWPETSRGQNNSVDPLRSEHQSLQTLGIESESWWIKGTQLEPSHRDFNSQGLFGFDLGESLNIMMISWWALMCMQIWNLPNDLAVRCSCLLFCFSHGNSGESGINWVESLRQR